MYKMLGKQKRGSIGLSVNFIVMMILAIVVFTLGIVVVTSIFKGANEIHQQMDAATKQRIESALMKSGVKVVLVDSNKNAFKGDVVRFSYGIKNNDATPSTFKVEVKCDNAYTKNNERVCDSDRGYSCVDLCDYWLFPIDEIEIPSNERHTDQIFIEIPSKPKPGKEDIIPATYTFDVEVKKDGVTYDVIKKIKVIMD